MIKLERFQKLAINGAVTAGLTGCLTALTFVLTPGSALAQNLAEQATNPTSALMQFQMIDQYNWETYNEGPAGGSSNSVIIQPVIPIKLNSKRIPLLVTRTTLPVHESTVNFGPGIGSHQAMGDTEFLAWAIPNFGLKGQTWGFGPSIVLPTANDEFTGQGKWQAGPTVVYINTQIPKTQFGFLYVQNFSFSGDSSRERVSKIFIQPIFTYHFGESGWYAAAQDVEWTYNYVTDKWTMPFGPQIGKVFKIGNQPVKGFAEVLYSPFHDGPSEKWTLRGGLTLLFPE